MSDSALRRQVAQLASELARTQAEVRTLRRGARRPQLGHSSIDSGSLDVVDSETGQVRLRLGWQPDGTVGMVPEGGDPHPAPAVPTVEPIPSGLSVSWDGTLDGLEVLPSDFDHVNVHVSSADGFAPGASTFTGTITRSGGVLPVAPLEVGATYYVRLVPVGTGGVQGTPSPQASGVPAPVGGVPGPGSITETEIADDAISTPKLQAEAVTALKIAAQAIEAGHIQAAAITAAKLEADLVLGTRIIAGDPAGARVELDENGLRGYDADDALVFAITDGNAVFTGNITGSEISGSRITIGDAPGNIGAIEDTAGVVRTRVTSSTGQRAQIAASDGQAEFTAWADPTTPSPVGGMFAQAGIVAMSMQSVAGDVTSPAVQIQASAGSAVVRLVANAPTDPDDRQGPGNLFANRSPSDDIAAVSLQSPRWEEPGDPASLRRSVLFAEGANTGRPYTRVVQAARRVIVMGEATGGGWDTTSDGMLELASTHSINAPRHAPARTDMAAQPTTAGNGNWIAFTSGQMPSVSFKTGWSGRVRVTIQICGYNNNTLGATLSVGFALSGASSVPVSLARAAMVRSMGTTLNYGRQGSQVVYLDLAGNADYTLSPLWRTSSDEAWSTAQGFDLGYQNSIIIEPLL